MRASICIVNLNAKKHLDSCLNSLESAMGNIPFETIVVDNNSYDGSVKLIEKKYTEVICIKNGRNEGYTRAMNMALLKAKGDYRIILNPDATCEEGSLSKIIQVMESDLSIGICGPKVVNEDGSFQKSCRRGIPRPQAVFSYFLGLANRYPTDERFTGYQLNHLDEDETNEVDAVSGSCSVIREKLINDIGLLDERYFAYQEDSDYCFRAKENGWKILYYPKSIINHIGGAGGAGFGLHSGSAQAE